MDMDLSYNLVYFLIQHLLYFLLNCGILVIFLNTERTSSYYFTMNLVFGSIITVLLLTVLGLDYYAIVDIKGPWLCGTQAFVKKLVAGVIPLTLVGISYERVRSLPTISNVGCPFPVWKVAFLTWGVGGILSSPQFFAYEFFTNSNPPDYLTSTNDSENVYNSSWSYNHVNPSENLSYSSSPHCRKTLLLGKVWVKVTYDSLICILLHFSPSAYIIYALHQIKFKWTYICLNKTMKKTIGPVLYKKLKQIRLAFFYSIVFALMWIPYGIITVWRSFTENPHRIVINATVNQSPRRTLQSCFEGAFVTLHPIVYLYTHHNARFKYYLKKCRIRNKAHVEDDSDDIMVISTIPMETFQPSI